MSFKSPSLLVLLVIIFALSCVLSTTAFDEEIQPQTGCLNRQINLYFNGSTKPLIDSNGNEVFPISYNGTTYLPVFSLVYSVSKSAVYDEYLSGFYISDEAAQIPHVIYADPSQEENEPVEITLSDDIVLYYRNESLSVKPIIYNGQIHVPLRAVYNLLGYQVEWDGFHRCIEIMSEQFSDAAKQIANGQSVDFPADTDHTILLGLEAYIKRRYPYGGDLGFKKIITNRTSMLVVSPEKMTAFLEENFEIKKEAEAVVQSLVRPEMSEKEKATILNDYLAYKYEYDYTYTERNIAQAWNSDRVTCTGYSRVFDILAKTAGIHTEIITQTIKTDDGPSLHMWNKVYINGIAYHVDVTWNDVPFFPNKYLLCSREVAIRQ